jgi:polyisoprenoid-binding protein YceI
MKYRWLPLLLVLSYGSAYADWALVNDASRLSFVSTKKDAVAEVHSFRELSGTMDNAGTTVFKIQLASVDTKVPVRDERMREMLFDTKTFPVATLTAKLDATKIEGLMPGQTMTQSIEGELSLHGLKHAVKAEVLIARLAADRLLVVSTAPLVVNAADFGLDAGIEKLRAVAQLPAISTAVPVSFVLTFHATR